MEKRMHLDEVISQRRFVSSFIKNYSSLHAPEQCLPDVIIPDTVDAGGEEADDDINSEGHQSSSPCRVQIQAEDYGGGISMPHNGHARPSADYFNSNLMIQNLVVADITNKRNSVYFYDERGQGKTADALCSLRLLYHLSTLQRNARNGIVPAEICLSLLDNCVGQNKSKVVLMFFAMLSVVFPYKKVVLCFLLPGHSHNIADRVVAWCRRAVRGINLYTPSQLVEEINKVKSVHGVFLDHNDDTRPFFIGWETLLSKYFTAPPAGYTSNYLFEIDKGISTARKTVNTPDEDATTFAMIDPSNFGVIRKAFISDLFGPTVLSIWEASMNNVRLAKHPMKELSEKKTKSLAAKYFSIPQEHLSYYLSVPDAVLNAPSATRAETTSKHTGQSGEQGKRGPGRPKKAKPQLKANQPSILQFFSSK